MSQTQKPFTSDQLEIICKILADTNSGLTGSEIGYILDEIKVRDVDPQNTKWKRLFNTFVDYQNKHQDGGRVLAFISKALKPVKYVNRKEIFDTYKEKINQVLCFYGLEFRDDGKFYVVKPVTTLSEAQERANRLKYLLEQRNVHAEILKYCNAELLQNNYFHAVLEASKGIADIIRRKTGLISDGAQLIDEALGGNNPVIKINKFITETEKSEQKGFINLAKGLFGTFRNPTAHAPKIEWEMTEQDALDVFSLASYIVRRIQ